MTDAMLSTHLSDLSPEIQLEIWHWLVDNYGMPTIITIITIISFAVIIYFFCKIAAMVKSIPQKASPAPATSEAPDAEPKQTQEQHVASGALPNFSGALVIGNGNTTTVNISAPDKQDEPKCIAEPPKPLRQRDWLPLTTPADKYERAAGFRAIGDIYHTAGDFPCFYILHASPRVYTATEEHYDGEAEPQYILLEQPDMITAPHRVRVCDDAAEQQKTLRELYELAHKRAEAGKATSVPL